MTDTISASAKRLLVPLDGSHMAEAAIEAARAVAAAYHAEVVLLHVLERGARPTIHSERHLTAAADAREYLEGIARRLRSEGIQVDTHVHDALEDDLARSVVQHAEEYRPDLVVLCAHGRGGFRQMLYGRVAQQVLQRGTYPVLLIQPLPERPETTPFAPKAILVPVDEGHDAAPAIRSASRMAHAFGATVHLALVVPTMNTLPGEQASSGLLLPATTRELLELSQQASHDYLEKIAEPLREEGITVHTIVLRGETVGAVLGCVAEVNANLLVMSSHGKAGLSAILSGSVGQRITAQATCPLLLVRTPAQPPRPS